MLLISSYQTLLAKSHTVKEMDHCVLIPYLNNWRPTWDGASKHLCWVRQGTNGICK